MFQILDVIYWIHEMTAFSYRWNLLCIYFIIMIYIVKYKLQFRFHNSYLNCCSSFPSSVRKKNKKNPQKTQSPFLCYFTSDQSTISPLQDGSMFMGFAQSDGLTGCYWFTSQPQMSILPLLGCVTQKIREKKQNIDHSGRWAAGSLAVLQCVTTIRKTVGMQDELLDSQFMVE